MRRTSGHSGHPASQPQHLEDAPRAPGPDLPQRHLPARTASPQVLRARADELLDRLRHLQRGPVRGTREDIDGIDAITDQLQALQSSFAAFAARELRGDQISDLAAARRSITDALLLTLEMLQRLR